MMSQWPAAVGEAVIRISAFWPMAETTASIRPVVDQVAERGAAMSGGRQSMEAGCGGHVPESALRFVVEQRVVLW